MKINRIGQTDGSSWAIDNDTSTLTFVSGSLMYLQFVGTTGDHAVVQGSHDTLSMLFSRGSVVYDVGAGTQLAVWGSTATVYEAARDPDFVLDFLNTGLAPTISERTVGYDLYTTVSIPNGSSVTLVDDPKFSMSHVLIHGQHVT